MCDRAVQQFSESQTTLGQKSRSPKVPRIFQIFVPNFSPNFAPNFPRIFRGFFVLRFVGDGDQKKFTKNPRHFSMQNSQANTKKIFTKLLWRAGKVKQRLKNWGSFIWMVVVHVCCNLYSRLCRGSDRCFPIVELPHRVPSITRTKQSYAVFFVTSSWSLTGYIIQGAPRGQTDRRTQMLRRKLLISQTSPAPPIMENEASSGIEGAENHRCSQKTDVFCMKRRKPQVGGPLTSNLFLGANLRPVTWVSWALRA